MEKIFCPGLSRLSGNNCPFDISAQELLSAKLKALALKIASAASKGASAQSKLTTAHIKEAWNSIASETITTANAEGARCLALYRLGFLEIPHLKEKVTSTIKEAEQAEVRERPTNMEKTSLESRSTSKEKLKIICPGVSHLSTNKCPLDISAQELLNEKLKALSLKIASAASKGASAKGKLNPAHIQEAWNSIASETRTSANAEGTRCLAMYKSGILKFGPKSAISTPPTTLTQASSRKDGDKKGAEIKTTPISITSDVFKAGLQAYVGGLSPYMVMQEDALERVQDILLDIGKAIAECSAKTSSSTLGTNELRKATNEIIPTSGLRQHALAEGAKSVTQFKTGVLYELDTLKKPEEPKKKTVKKTSKKVTTLKLKKPSLKPKVKKETISKKASEKVIPPAGRKMIKKRVESTTARKPIEKSQPSPKSKIKPSTKTKVMTKKTPKNISKKVTKKKVTTSIKKKMISTSPKKPSPKPKTRAPKTKPVKAPSAPKKRKATEEVEAKSLTMKKKTKKIELDLKPKPAKKRTVETKPVKPSPKPKTRATKTKPVKASSAPKKRKATEEVEAESLTMKKKTKKIELDLKPKPAKKRTAETKPVKSLPKPKTKASKTKPVKASSATKKRKATEKVEAESLSMKKKTKKIELDLKPKPAKKRTVETKPVKPSPKPKTRATKPKPVKTSSAPKKRKAIEEVEVESLTMKKKTKKIELDLKPKPAKKRTAKTKPVKPSPKPKTRATETKPVKASSAPKKSTASPAFDFQEALADIALSVYDKQKFNLSTEAMCIVNTYLNDVCIKLMTDSVKETGRSGIKELGSQQIRKAVLDLFSYDLAQHALARAEFIYHCP